ncbi:MAG: hypothetical protein ACQEXO_01215 [Pseudomonadota bacterium]
MTPANRWLIAVLLAHADDVGRVTGLSYTRLGHLTGMSRSQLQSQIPKLRSQGVLAYHQPGRLGRLCGCQMTSIFVLDLDHRLIRPESRAEVSVTMYSARNGKQQLRTVVNSLVEALFVVARYQVQATDTARRAESLEALEQDERTVADARALLPKAFDPGPLARQLARAYDADSANWLQVRLHGYAEQLLSHGWDALSAGQGGPGHPVGKVIDAIARDFPERPESPNQQGSSEPISEGAASAQSDAGLIQADSVTEADDSHAPHVILLYALAHHLAVQLQPWLIQTTREKGGVRLQELSFSLTPDPLRGLSLVRVQGFGKRSSDQRRPISAFVPLDPAVRSDMTTWLT